MNQEYILFQHHMLVIKMYIKVISNESFQTFTL